MSTAWSPGCCVGGRPGRVSHQYWVECGRRNRCNGEGGGEWADTSELHEVRCCSDVNLQGFSNSRCNDVWAASDVSDCHSSKSFSAAESICQNAGARLCTKEELEGNCARKGGSSGCGLDSELVWTSDNAPA